jgi:hypothetical protein
MHLLCSFYQFFWGGFPCKANRDDLFFPPPCLLLGSSFQTHRSHRPQNYLHIPVTRHFFRKLVQPLHALPRSTRHTHRRWCRQSHNYRGRISGPKLERVPAAFQSLVHSLAVLHHCGSTRPSTELGSMRYGRLQCSVLGCRAETLGWI